MFRSLDERVGWGLVAGLGLLPPLAVLVLCVFLFVNGAAALAEIPLGELLSTRWLPLDERFGMLPLILGTSVSTLLALALAIPVGLAAAIYLALWAGSRTRALADSAIALLGAMPSVILGLWGLTWIVPAVGNSLAAAALVLALMITPTFTLLAGAALRQVPAELVEAVRALGVSDDVAAGVAVGHARWGILGAATLAATRGLGEAVAVSMVAGNVGLLPTRLEAPVATLTTTLIVEFDGATGVHRSALYLAALVVILLISAVSLGGRSLQRRRV